MKNKFIQIVYSILVFSIMLVSCNKESFIENAGAISVVGTNPTNNTGSITIWTSNPLVTICSAGLRISIDGNFKGSISDYSSVDINCGTNGTKSITIILSEGSHSYTANGTGTFCPKYSGSFTVKKGKCVALELTK